MARKQKRSRRGRDYWTGLVHEFERGNSSQSEFARRHDVNPVTFGAWVRRLRSEGSVPGPPEFVEVVGSTESARAEVVLRFGSVEIEFRTQPRSQVLGKLVREALRARRC